jgi:hypothetical protein
MWTKAEDGVLLDLVQQRGKDWGFIAAHLPQRTTTQIASRWEKCLDPNLRKGQFTADEDRAIAGFVAQHGPRCWPQIVALLPHRSAKQCRERWLNHLDPAVVKAEWSAQEDERIFAQVEAHGAKWSQIAKLFPGRSDNAIKNRWNSSISKRIADGAGGGRRLLPDASNRRYRPRERAPAERRGARAPPPPLRIPAAWDIGAFPPDSMIETPSDIALMSPTFPFDKGGAPEFEALSSAAGAGPFALSPIEAPGDEIL